MPDPQPAPVSIRSARGAEASALSDLAFRSKAYWNYPSEFMAACREALRVDRERVDACDSRVRLAEIAGKIAGFYVLDAPREKTCELDALFVEPQWIGRGIGRALMDDAIATARGLGARRLVIQGDPHATRFYRAAGAVRIGQRASASIPGRDLPLFEIDLDIA